MLSSKQKLEVGVVFLMVIPVVFGVGCNGFFVNPTLTSLTVGPTASIQQGKTVQMSAVGTYNDGSTSPISSVFWSSSATNIAAVSSSGLVMGVSPGQATITGASGTVTGSATVTVTLTGLTAITVTPQGQSLTQGNGLQFTATGTANGAQVNISGEVTWSLTNTTLTTSDYSFSSTGFLTTNSNIVAVPTQVTVTATDPTTQISGNTKLTINP